LEQFRDPWNALLQANPGSSIFQTPEWLAAWWRCFGKGKRLFGLVFTAPTGTVVGLAPLYAERMPFIGHSLTRLRLVGSGSGDSDALDLIVRPGYEQSCAQAFATWLTDNSREWDVCSMETLPQDSLIAEHLSHFMRKSRWSIDVTRTPNFVVDLPPTWSQYLSTLESAFRPLLTRYPKRLQSRFKVRMLRCENPDDLAVNLQTLFRLHQMRWTGRGEPGGHQGRIEQTAREWLTCDRLDEGQSRERLGVG